MHIVHPCRGCFMYCEIVLKISFQSWSSQRVLQILRGKGGNQSEFSCKLKKCVFKICFTLIFYLTWVVVKSSQEAERRSYMRLSLPPLPFTLSCCWVVCNRPVGVIACLCGVFSTRVHGNKTGMTRPSHRSLQDANAEQNKRRYSAHFLYNSTPSFSAPEASTAGTMAGPPPDLISTWHDLSIKRPFLPLASRRAFLLLTVDRRSHEQVGNNDPHSSEPDLWKRRHEIGPSLHITPCTHERYLLTNTVNV